MLLQTNLLVPNPLIPNAHNSECQNLLFPLQIKPVKVNEDFYFCALGTNGLRKEHLEKGISELWKVGHPGAYHSPWQSLAR